MIAGVPYLKMRNLDHYDKVCRWFDGNLCKIKSTVPFSTYRKGDLRCIDFSSELLKSRVGLHSLSLDVLDPSFRRREVFGAIEDSLLENPVFFVLENPMVCYEVCYEGCYVDIVTQILDVRMSLFIKILHNEKIFYINTTLNRIKHIPSRWFSDVDRIVKELTPNFSEDNMKKLILLTNDVIYNPY